MPQEPPVREEEKDIDILFYGWVGKRTRRDSTLRLLQGPHHNLSIHVISTYVYRCATLVAAAGPLHGF